MIIRKVKVEDHAEIKSLANKYKINVFNKTEWEKIWNENPLLKDYDKEWVKGWVMVEKDKIVGHIGNIPTQYTLNKKTYTGSVINCWVVEEKYRLHSINLIKEYHSQQDIDFFIATTSSLKTSKILPVFGWKKMPIKDYDKKLNIILNFKNVYQAYLEKKFKKFKYIFEHFSRLGNLLLSKRINFWKKLKKDNEFEVYKQFDKTFDEFWEKMKIKNKEIFLFNRKSDWMNWHLNNKIKENNLLILVKKKDGKIIGYAVCIYKQDKDLNLKKAVLIDIMLLNNDDKIFIDLILNSINHSLKSSCDLFQIVGFNEEKRKLIYKLKPFVVKNKFSTFYFNVKNLILNDFLSKKQYWDPSELDGDSIY